MRKNVQKIIRLLQRNKQTTEILKIKNKALEKNAHIENLIQCLKAIKFLFVKKLSTGYDEDQTHNQLLMKLEGSIQLNTQMLNSKSTELENLINTRKKDNDFKNNEIKKLKEELDKLKRE